MNRYRGRNSPVQVLRTVPLGNDLHWFVMRGAMPGPVRCEEKGLIKDRD